MSNFFGRFLAGAQAAFDTLTDSRGNISDDMRSVNEKLTAYNSCEQEDEECEDE